VSQFFQCASTAPVGADGFCREQVRHVVDIDMRSFIEAYK
jgi:hypothetical protein